MDITAEQIAQLPVTAFHVTRVSMAKRIMRARFAPLPVSDEHKAVADADNVPGPCPTCTGIASAVTTPLKR